MGPGLGLCRLDSGLCCKGLLETEALTAVETLATVMSNIFYLTSTNTNTNTVINSNFLFNMARYMQISTNFLQPS